MIGKYCRENRTPENRTTLRCILLHALVCSPTSPPLQWTFFKLPQISCMALRTFDTIWWLLFCGSIRHHYAYRTRTCHISGLHAGPHGMNKTAQWYCHFNDTIWPISLSWCTTPIVITLPAPNRATNRNTGLKLPCEGVSNLSWASIAYLMLHVIYSWAPYLSGCFRPWRISEMISSRKLGWV